MVTDEHLRQWRGNTQCALLDALQQVAFLSLDLVLFSFVFFSSLLLYLQRL